MATLQLSTIPLRQRNSPSTESTAIRYDDLTKERPIEVHTEAEHLPEDHLEDLISLPLAQELIPRRTRLKAFPISNTVSNNTLFSPDNAIDASEGVPHTEELALKVEHSPSPSTEKVFTPPRNPEDVRKQTQSTPLGFSNASRDNVPVENPPQTHLNGQKSNSSAQSTAKRIKGNGKELSLPSLTAGEAPRSRTVTNNVLHSRKQPSTPSSSPRRPAQARSTAQPREAFATQKKSLTSSPASSTISRSRSHSASLLSSPYLSSSRNYDQGYDPSAKPPWQDDNPEYLYKSDIASPPMGSLAHIALHAQGRLKKSSPSSDSHLKDSYETTVGDDSFDAGAGNVSTHSWDNVIIPAVAKQIRARQALELQNNSESQQTNGLEDEEMLVTEWNLDGTPRKWTRIPRKPKVEIDAASGKEEDTQRDEEVMQTQVPDEQQPEIQKNVPQSLRTLPHRPSRQNVARSPSAHSQTQTSHAQQDTTSSLTPSPLPSLHSSSSHTSMHRRRQQASSILSNNQSTALTVVSSKDATNRGVKRQNLEWAGSTDGTHTGSDPSAEQRKPIQTGQHAMKLQAQEEKLDKEAEGTHKSGCCRCIIM